MSAQPTIKKTTLKPLLIDVNELKKSKFQDLFKKAAGYRSSQRAKCRALGLLYAKQKARFGLNEAADDGTPRRVRNPLELSNGEIADFFEVRNASPAETHLLLLHEALLDLEPLKPRPAQLLLQLTGPVSQDTPEGSENTDDNASLKLLLEEEQRVAATLRQERDQIRTEYGEQFKGLTHGIVELKGRLRDLQARYDRCASAKAALQHRVKMCESKVREICKDSIHQVVIALAEKFKFDPDQANKYLNEPVDLTQETV